MKKVKPYKRKKKDADYNEYNQQRESSDKSKIGMYVIIAVIIGFFVIKPIVSIATYQDVSFVAKDGHSLPFASVVVYRNGEAEYKRTKNDGSLRIEKKGLEKIVINDKRYVKTTWQASELEDVLLVKRTILGSGLDILANKLLQPSKE